ncbi:Hsp20/alpha crystallin family protein [Aggregicoccus sp. 17bor-14]|uniref:Hsp20/alpha crystallin family protein n=1 Tax=Myxococcaceae TaxID=31 RepID=UPI00129CFB7B|nr:MULTISPECIES: Hsp20/alpha crystallin family protein [Myxococcaceae]MBF5045074.1 Hsp20/alpha crystallin family protein [Simulacricoccus sp. 17bor-14]MRI90816.1 Hsp20/alpha crystallin family protein [Aggregicoccus sp. 17bor-14]
MLSRYNSRTANTPDSTHPFDALLRDFALPFNSAWGFAEPRSLAPAADIQETEAGLTLELDMPGHAPEGIEVKVENDRLTVRSERKSTRNPEQSGQLLSERRFGTFERAFVLPRTVDAGRVEARYEHGVLTLVLPRREESKPRTVQVQVK